MLPEDQPGGTYFPPADAAGESPIAVALSTHSVTIRWRPFDCAAFDLLLAITPEGRLTGQRELYTR